MRLQNAIGSTLREVRLSKQMYLRELSRKSHVGLSHLSDIENSNKQPSFGMLAVIIRSLDMTDQEFLMKVHDRLGKEQ